MCTQTKRQGISTLSNLRTKPPEYEKVRHIHHKEFHRAADSNVLHLAICAADAVLVEIYRRAGRQGSRCLSDYRTAFLRIYHPGAYGSATCNTFGEHHDIRQPR